MTEKTLEHGSHESYEGQMGGFAQGYFGQQNPQFTGCEIPFAQQYSQAPYMHSIQQTSFGLCYDIIEEGNSLVIEIPFPGLIRDTLDVVLQNRWVYLQGKDDLITPADRVVPQCPGSEQP